MFRPTFGSAPCCTRLQIDAAHFRGNSLTAFKMTLKVRPAQLIFRDCVHRALPVYMLASVFAGACNCHRNIFYSTPLPHLLTTFIVLPSLICTSLLLSYFFSTVPSPPSLSFTLGSILFLPLVTTSPFPPPLPFSPQVYCAGMQTETPQEYITLTTGEGENFSEIFGFR